MLPVSQKGSFFFLLLVSIFTLDFSLSCQITKGLQQKDGGIFILTYDGGKTMHLLALNVSVVTFCSETVVCETHLNKVNLLLFVCVLSESSQTIS